jgi:hypothetical protein
LGKTGVSHFVCFTVGWNLEYVIGELNTKIKNLTKRKLSLKFILIHLRLLPMSIKTAPSDYWNKQLFIDMGCLASHPMMDDAQQQPFAIKYSKHFIYFYF